MLRLLPLFLAWFLFSSFASAQADYKRFYDEDKLPMIRDQFMRGRHMIVIQNSDYAIRRGQQSPEWYTLKMRSLAALGRYQEATEIADSVVKRFPKELPSLLDVHEIYRITGQKEKISGKGDLQEGASPGVLDLLNKAAAAIPAKDRDSQDLVYLGKAALLLGADPSKVLENYYTPAKRVEKKGKKAPPGLVEAHWAAGDLALEKSDFKLAAEEFRAGLKYDPNHTELRFGLAMALLPDNRKKGMEEIDKILENHSFHFGALLYRAETAINYEKYSDARAFIKVVHGINPEFPAAWALLAVLAELEHNNKALFDQNRGRALEVWGDDPEIDYLIGRVLSRNYRFAEGAESQRRALASDPNFLPAKLQLALDYLRIGDEDQAWPLAKQVADADQYNVLAYNLEILEEEIASFATIKSDNFVIRLPQEEAELYGGRALELLEEARIVLCPKYGIELAEPTLVEFFPNQEDFAIRSFGSLGGAGLLGVCFGSVVTMNSPGSMAHGKITGRRRCGMSLSMW